MDAKHTPGPWRVGNKGADSVFTESQSRICSVMPRYDDPSRASVEDFANARLIAAAPDLLAACKACRVELICVINSVQRAYDLVLAAIAKARGSDASLVGGSPCADATAALDELGAAAGRHTQ